MAVLIWWTVEYYYYWRGCSPDDVKRTLRQKAWRSGSAALQTGEPVMWLHNYVWLVDIVSSLLLHWISLLHRAMSIIRNIVHIIVLFLLVTLPFISTFCKFLHCFKYRRTYREYITNISVFIYIHSTELTYSHTSTAGLPWLVIWCHVSHTIATFQLVFLQWGLVYEVVLIIGALH